MPTEYARALGGRLRAIRTQQGLSLHGVEEKSDGRWKAVVVGSYERGDRAVTVQRLAELADFYAVPVSELLPDSTPQGAAEPPPRLILDLEKLQGGPVPWRATPRPSRRSAATTTAGCSRSARRTCAPWPSSTTRPRRSSPSSSSCGASSTPRRAAPSTDPPAPAPRSRRCRIDHAGVVNCCWARQICRAQDSMTTRA